MAATIPPLLRSIRAEADQIAPKRSKRSDGIIGDAAHASRESDHNPDARGVVHAIDITHDPAAGFNARAEAENLRQRCQRAQEHRCKYVVSYDDTRKRDIIASASRDLLGAPWGWRYQSTADHSTHMHISILTGVAVEQSTGPMLRPELFMEGPVAGTIVDACATPEGYLMVSDKGYVYHWGGPHFGGWGGMPLNAPIVAIAPYVKDGKTHGYWLFAADGGVLTFGLAPYLGNTVGIIP
jgi:hypothetical protein